MIERRAVLLALGAVLIAGPAFGDADCKYKGATYSHGSAVCQSGSQYRCDDGQWSGLAIACTESRSPSVVAKSCAFDGNSYSPGSASCQSGTQYRCYDNGRWRDDHSDECRPMISRSVTNRPIQPNGSYRADCAP
jgi:hypothetical protein